MGVWGLQPRRGRASLWPVLKSKILASFVIVGSLLLLGGSLTGCSKSKSGKNASADASANAPKIAVVTKVHDFGKATDGDKLKHVFEVENKGSAPLAIDRVTTSCGCVTAVVKDKQIAPGAKGSIEVTFDTTGRRGSNRKTVTVLSNDPSNPRAQLEVVVNVESMLAFDPFFVRLSPEYGQEQVREAWVVGKLVDQAKISITEKSEDKTVTVELAEKDEAGKKVQGVRFKLKGSKVGYGSGRVVVATGIEKPNQLVLRYSWSVRGNLRVLPAQLFFDQKRAPMRERVVRVSSSRPDFKLKDVKIASGPFDADMTLPDAGKAYEVRVKLKGEGEPKVDANGEAGKLVLISNDPLEPKKEVSLRLSASRPGGPDSAEPRGGPGRGGPAGMIPGPGGRPHRGGPGAAAAKPGPGAGSPPPPPAEPPASP